MKTLPGHQKRGKAPDKIKRMSRRINYIVPGIIIIVIVLLVALYFYTGSKLNEKIPIPEGSNELLVIIPGNATISKAVNILNKKGIFLPRWYFLNAAKLYARIFDTQLYAGTYRFTAGNTNLHVMRAIFSGRQQFVVRVTYPEGLNLKEFASITQKKLGIDSSRFIAVVNSDSILKAYDIPRPTAEGYLMPNTYRFYWKQNIYDVVAKLLSAREKSWNRRFAGLAQKEGRSEPEILTMASIIEAETPVKEEMPRVSGVYYNRLEKGWKLEADPTVQYAIGKKKKLYYSDLDYDSPYNTYKYKGLPPGPINNPGNAAIMAALKPEKNNFMYFVARGDGSGMHYFARTAAEHARYKAIYKHNGAKNIKADIK